MFSTDLSTRSYDGYAVIALRGELDLVDAEVIAAELTRVATREPAIIIDLAGLEFIDCSGVAALERGRRQARQAGGDLILAAPRRNVVRVLALLQLAEAFSIYATVEAAAGQPRHFKEAARLVSQHPGKARWPGAVMWSRTSGLRTLHSDRTSSVLDLAAAPLLPPAAAGLEE
jgi:anti-sigma B factor antagonist